MLPDIKQLYLLLAIFMRFYASMLICPLFNSSYFTNILKAALALVMAIIVLPLFSNLVVNTNIWAYSFIVFKEFAYGLVLSYMLGLPFWLIQSTGNIIDSQRGEQLGAIINKFTSSPDSSLAKLLLQGFITYFVISNGFLFFYSMVFKSFQLFPLGTALMAHNVNVYIDIFVDYIYWVVVLSLPIVILMLLLDFILGVLSSFVPQLNTTVISMPLKSALAMLLLFFYLAILYHEIFAQFISKLYTLLP